MWAVKKGFKRRKTGSLAPKADRVKQNMFVQQVLQPLMKMAEQGNAALLFMDASHFVIGCDFPGYLWCRVRRHVKTFPDCGA